MKTAQAIVIFLVVSIAALWVMEINPDGVAKFFHVSRDVIVPPNWPGVSQNSARDSAAQLELGKSLRGLDESFYNLNRALDKLDASSKKLEKSIDELDVALSQYLNVLSKFQQ